jgi:hypothetical protein
MRHFQYPQEIWYAALPLVSPAIILAIFMPWKTRTQPGKTLDNIFAGMDFAVINSN